MIPNGQLVYSMFDRKSSDTRLGLIPGNVAARHCCQQCSPRVNSWQLEAPAMGQAGNKLFHSNQMGDFVRCPCLKFCHYLTSKLAYHSGITVPSPSELVIVVGPNKGIYT